MRLAKKTQDGRWYILEEEDGVYHIRPAGWGRDRNGYWPRVDLVVRGLEETVVCPHCGNTWVFEEMDCVFGRSRKDGNDVLVLVRCVNCRLPHRVRALGLITAYPRVAQLMEGWAEWEKRRGDFEAEEEKLYGRTEE